MDNDPAPTPVDPGMVKYLRLLVTILTGTMILGFIVIVAVFVTKFPGDAGPALPDRITLPDGTAPAAFTRGDDWYAVVTDDDRILIFDGATGTLRQSIDIE
ncbi:DUF6476 family protein [Roseovarius sp. SYSU LYC5161]|uniref:DUF6476 family protein n=1 Tax=Roseovarius halophilus (ex Wu et al. 2025) TaxID=3376060 RepID=UPI0028714009|nr:DUF6476 family protein [Roseovarius sp.]